MIPTTNPILFQASLQQLALYKRAVGRNFKGRLIQLFLGLKFYQNQIPSMHSGRFISAEVLQILLDDLYAKSSQPLDSAVLMIFEGSYLARTGVTAAGHAGPQNTWRNNLNIQKGNSSGKFRIEHRYPVWGDYDLCFPITDLYRNTVSHNEIEQEAA